MIRKQSHLIEILEKFDAPIRFCAAYGSAVFPQRQRQTTSNDSPMIDFIFGVTHPQHWHSLNIRQHPQHYSAARFLGSKSIQMIQDNFGAGLYYNAKCVVGDHTVKYGVISMEELLDDLENWETMYCAGRFHKPIKILHHDARMDLAQMQNLKSAVNTALLLLPENFTEEELFRQITSLSYTGDFRMKISAESPHKIYNIVYAQMEEFTTIYQPIIDSLPFVDYKRSGHLQRDVSSKANARIIKELPVRFKERLIKSHLIKTGGYIHDDLNEVIQEAAESPELTNCVRKALKDTILWPSISQALKGIITAGPLTSIGYAARKLQKGFQKQ